MVGYCSPPITYKLTEQDVGEIADLYSWGMEMWMLRAFYGVDRKTITYWLKKKGVAIRPTGKPRHLDLDTMSNRRRKLADGQLPEPNPFEDAYQAVREHARALRDKRTAPRPTDVSTHSYLAAAS